MPEFVRLVAGTPFQVSPAKSDSSSESSSSCGSVNTTPRFGMKGSKVVTKKSPPFVPRLDLSGTGAGVKVEAREETSLAFRQKPPQPPCDQFENPSRRTSRRTDSARLISLTDADDRFGGSNDSARTMLSRIKRRAKGGSCGGEAGGPISVTSSGNHDNHVVKKPGLEEVVVVADDLHREPSILEVVEPTTAVMMQSVPESGFTEIACKDGEIRPILHRVAFFLSIHMVIESFSLGTLDMICRGSWNTCARASKIGEPSRFKHQSCSGDGPAL